MATPLEVVQGVYDRFAAEDMKGFLGLCAEDIEWVVNGPPHLEKCQAFRGHSGVQRFLDLLAVWELSAFTPKEFLVDGKTVVVLGEEAGMDKASDVSFQNRWAHVFDVEGDRVVRFREFLCHWPDPEEPPAMSWGSD